MSSTPRGRLWSEIGDMFEYVDTSHAGPDVGFHDLAPDDVERIWQHLLAASEGLDPTQTVWDEQGEREVAVVEVLAQGAIAAQARFPHVLVRLRGIRSGDAVLPWLGVDLFPDGVSFYWWVGDGWDPDLVAGLARLVGELRALAPTARLAFEWGDSGPDFWRAVEDYLASRG